jgi:aminoglycoside phosphotransferase (APT) family kinase protein
LAIQGSDDNTARLTDGDNFLDALRRDGVVRHHDAKLTPLTDGVSSDIFRVDDGPDTFVVKRALPKLRVKNVWFADIGRNRYERMYIEYVGQFLPQAVPSLRAGGSDRGYFVMEYLDAFSNWKRMLLSGEAHVEHAVQAATVLGRVHARSASDADVARRFNNTANFIQLRIDPYLLTTGRRHSDLRALFEAEAQRLTSTRECLVHGDFSPKNIMIAASRLVLLDCEVAWYGDPAFDLAFLLTHLLLKGIYHAPQHIDLHEMALAFWQGYLKEAAVKIDLHAVEPRVARLLLMLLLARMDGKSPVEYLTEPERMDWVRQFARPRILANNCDLNTILSEWFGNLKQYKTQQ